MEDYTSFLIQNKEKLWQKARKTNKYNAKGQCMMSTKDEDYTHNEWEIIYKIPKEVHA